MTAYRAINYICKKCKQIVHEEDNYCRNCGKKLCQVRLAKIEQYIWGR